jgi:hypothetical protein
MKMRVAAKIKHFKKSVASENVAPKTYRSTAKTSLICSSCLRHVIMKVIVLSLNEREVKLQPYWINAQKLLS